LSDQDKQDKMEAARQSDNITAANQFDNITWADFSNVGDELTVWNQCRNTGISSSYLENYERKL